MYDSYIAALILHNNSQLGSGDRDVSHQPAISPLSSDSGSILALLAAPIAKAGMPEKHTTPRRVPFPLNTETYAGFKHAFKEASEQSPTATDALRNSVSTCVAELKCAGLGPETVLVTMKACVRHFGEKHFRRMGWDPRSVIANLSHQITTWCIEDYYSRR